MGSESEYVSITRWEYEALQSDSDLLSALKTVGVDNWSGYAEALALLNMDMDS